MTSHFVKGLTPYVDFCGSMYLVAQNLTRHDDSIYLVIGNMTYDYEILNAKNNSLLNIKQFKKVNCG